MSVIITPAEQLEFHRPFTRISKESLIVKNPGTEPIAFKVKTTAPKQYCVRPNAGRIEPNSDVEVQIILQPFKDELPDDFKCKDKFLVQTAPIKEAYENLDISSMWSQIEATERGSMHQHKIKCVFLPPSNELVTEGDKVTSIPDTAEPIASSSIPTVTSEPQTTEPKPPAPVPAPVVEAKPVTATTPSPVKTTSPPVVQAREIKKETPVVDHKKEEELKVALEKIALLEKQLADIRREEGLRARNQTGTSNRKLAPTVQPLDAVHQHLAALEKPRPTEGYPPQVVFGVAFVVFIITYLFF